MYWVSLGFDFTQLKLNISQVNDLENALQRSLSDDKLKTRDLELAQKVANVAWRVFHKHNPTKSFADSRIRIGVQPYCTKCHLDTKFSQTVCNTCNTPLVRVPLGIPVVFLNGSTKQNPESKL
jgi:hypothetical protein